MRPEDLSGCLADIKASGLYRTRRTLSGSGVDVRFEGASLINFCSNDYLGLANHPEVIQSFQRASESYGVGSGASHLISGHSFAHQALEEELAEFTGRPRALLFSTGFMANMGVIATISERNDVLFQDRLNHVSLLEGARLSGSKLKRYAHGDVESLKSLLAESTASGRMVVTDGVFSMDGDLAPLQGLTEAALNSNAWMMVDDAHGLGVLGANGGGVLEHFGLNGDRVQILVGTFGKAFGTFGAFVAGSEDLIDYMIQRCRTYAYTTAVPPAVAEATRASLRLIQAESWRREKLVALIRRFREGAEQLGLNLLDSATPIQPLIVGSNEAALSASLSLRQKGFLVAAIRPPTVPVGSARLRITFSAAHEFEQVDQLLDALKSIFKS